MGASDTIEVIYKGRDESLSKVTGAIGKSIGGMGAAIATGLKVGVAAMAAGGVATIGFGAKLVSLGSDAAETSSLIQNSLGEATAGYTDELKKFSREANRSFFELQQAPFNPVPKADHTPVALFILAIRAVFAIPLMVAKSPPT